ncbi:NADH-quinone oxidoreductase subunit H [Fulvitalea axinellae]|uniref:NADH-quinone oxidoreductase subunit H n=1 Tax=Fulvitalea axinellae TaxID=1182444 RepID=A0AAU9D8Q9_9BACT|nr:NADH-quinone oxidoreductase subunit H [Fulvitalea axinellae]
MTTFIFYLPFILLFALAGVYIERKVSAFMQDRVGPLETGYWGLLQTLADILKLIQKEDIQAKSTDKILFSLAPIIVMSAVIAGFSVFPITPGWAGSATETGVFFMLAIVSLDVVGILMAGWGSNSKFSLFGALRSVAQIISYEIPLTLSVLAVLVISQTLDMQEISFQQGPFLKHISTDLDTNYLFGIKALGVDVTDIGGILTWNIFRSPVLLVAFLIFYISGLAECNRAPFDLPESESELIAGFHTEYSGVRFAILMLSEYAMMLLISVAATVLFLGSWNSPLPNIGSVRLWDWTMGEPGTIVSHVWGIFWITSKAIFIVFTQMWVRWTYPRLRIDQLMSLGWKYLTPLSLIVLFIATVWRLLMI